MLDAVGEHSQSQDLRGSGCLRLRGPVDHDAWQLRNLGDPPPVFLTFDHDRQLHGCAPGAEAKGYSGRGGGSPSGSVKALEAWKLSAAEVAATARGLRR
jgi:hypothetical protein